MKKPLDIVIDVDLTIVDPSPEWMLWQVRVFDMEPVPVAHPARGVGGVTSFYDLSKYFPVHMRKSNVSPFEFWEDHFLYDKLLPLPGAVEGIKKLKQAGHNIKFASVCKHGHFSSKVRHIKLHYPFVDLGKTSKGDGFYATMEKGGIRADIIIDDRNAHLNQFDDHTVKVLYPSPFDQDVPLDTTPDIVGVSWEDGLADVLLDNYG